MAHDASNNNPTKETLTALVGTVLLLVMIAAIGIFAWLRPAGEHQPKAPTAEEVAAAEAEAAAETAPATEATVAPAEETAPAAEATEAPATQASDAAVAEAQDKLDQTPENAQAPTQATATAETPAAASAPSDTTNAAPAPESAEDKEAAKTE
ncbi:hypothetical protein [Moraxella sp.]|uniref:hypothetical protein n=1 Tax=Moraxella sp. TaxID=479 RepID=UPI00260C2D93|nr:hypothetical protein [Moraxella sp.]